MEKENTIIFEWSNLVKYNLIWLLYEFSIYFCSQGLGSPKPCELWAKILLTKNKLKTHIYQSILTRTTKMDVINIIINEIIDLTSIWFEFHLVSVFEKV